MNTLIFVDVGGNDLRFAINHSAKQDQWLFDNFLEFMQLGPEAANKAGFPFIPEDHIRHERFRSLVNNPISTLNSALHFVQDGQQITKGGSFILGDDPPLVEIKRDPNSVATLDPKDISLKERNHSIFHHYPSLLADAIDLTVNRKSSPNQTRLSFLSLVNTKPDQEILTSYLLQTIQAVHRAPFENWSKFEHQMPYRNGHEMWINYANGRGGVCSEKTSSLKFICDLLGIENQPVIGTETPLSPKQLKSLADYFLSNGRNPPPCDIKHLLIEVHLGKDIYLIDATGGNVPLMVLNEPDAKPFYESGYSVRMVSRTDKLFLSRVPLWVGDAHLTVCEYHLPEAHFDLTFDQDLGLEITNDQYTGAFFDYGNEHTDRMRKLYERISTQQNLDPPLFVNKTFTSDQPIKKGMQFYHNARTNILHSYRDKNYTGDVTLVIQPLNNNFWDKPMISKKLASFFDQAQTSISP